MDGSNRFAILEDGTTPCIAVSGEIDMESAQHFQNGLARALSAGRSGLVVDLSRATFMDTAALHGLVNTLEQLRERGGRLALVAADARIKALFEVARLDQKFEIFSSREAAVQAVTLD